VILKQIKMFPALWHMLHAVVNGLGSALNKGLPATIGTEEIQDLGQKLRVWL